VLSGGREVIAKLGPGRVCGVYYPETGGNLVPKEKGDGQSSPKCLGARPKEGDGCSQTFKKGNTG